MQDKTDFIKTIRDNEALIFKVAKLYTHNKEDEQDLYQDIVYQLWKSFESFRNESKITTWMYRIALNTSIAWLNKEKRTRGRSAINEAFLNVTTEIDAAREERIETLYATIRKLNPAEKAIVLLYLDGRSYEEISAITGFSVSNVGTRLGRIRQKLSAEIKK